MPCHDHDAAATRALRLKACSSGRPEAPGGVETPYRAAEPQISCRLGRREVRELEKFVKRDVGAICLRRGRRGVFSRSFGSARPWGAVRERAQSYPKEALAPLLQRFRFMVPATGMALPGGAGGPLGAALPASGPAGRPSAVFRAVRLCAARGFGLRKPRHSKKRLGRAGRWTRSTVGESSLWQARPRPVPPLGST